MEQQRDLVEYNRPHEGGGQPGALRLRQGWEGRAATALSAWYAGRHGVAHEGALEVLQARRPNA